MKLLLAAAARRLALTRGEQHCLREAEEYLLRFLQSGGFVDPDK